MSRVRVLTFLEKKGQDVSGAYISIGRRHFGMFSASRAGTTSRASTADTPPVRSLSFSFFIEKEPHSS